MEIIIVISLGFLAFVVYLFFSNAGKDYTKKSDLELIQLLGLHKNNVSAASNISHERHQAALVQMSSLTVEMKKRGLIKKDTVQEDPTLERTLDAIAQKHFSKNIKDIKAAAVGNDAQALYQMAMIFHVSKETETSREYMSKSAEAGYVDAQYALGWTFLQGNGKTVAEDNASEAIKWFKIASVQGHTEAGKAVDTLRDSVSQIVIDRAFEEADRWLTAHSDMTSALPL